MFHYRTFYHKNFQRNQRGRHIDLEPHMFLHYGTQVDIPLKQVIQRHLMNTKSICCKLNHFLIFFRVLVVNYGFHEKLNFHFTRSLVLVTYVFRIEILNICENKDKYFFLNTDLHSNIGEYMPLKNEMW